MIARQLTDLRRGDLDLAGGKGANLGELLAAGLPVPDGFVLTTDAYRAFVTENDLQPRIAEALSGSADTAAETIASLFATGTLPPAIADALRSEYAGLGTDVPVAVRSSATAEDLAEASFAGQQESVLNVHGAAAIETAVRRCWASLWTPRAIEHRSAHQVTGDLAMAVVVQRLVDATAAGVMFTANPTTGRTDEIVISAAWGLGEAVVSANVTTDDVTVRDGRVTERRTAAKNTHTVLTENSVAEQPTTPDQRDAAVLTDADALRLAELGGRAAAHIGAPQNLEWARDTDGTFWLVQSRPIAGLPDPPGPAPTEWPVPADYDVYIRGSIVEQLPDPLSPLFADLATQLVVPGMLRTLDEFVAHQRLFSANDLSLVTINGYAYYGYRNALLLKAARMTPFALKLACTSMGRERWHEVFRPRYAEVVERHRARDPRSLTASRLLDGIAELAGEGFAYYASVQTIMLEAVTSEVLFTSAYNRLIKRPGDPRAEVFLLGLDSAPLRADQSIYDLAQWVRDDPDLVGALQAGADPLDGAPTELPPGLWAPFRDRLQAHLATFGHATYNLDLVNPVAVDDPGPVLAALRFYLRDDAVSPRDRQDKLAARRIAARESILARLSGPRRMLFTRLLDFANAMGPVREDALADVGLGWPTARAYARELGWRLVGAGALSDPDDVYWVRHGELSEAVSNLDGDEPVTAYAERVAKRKATWRGQRAATPPPILPLDSKWRAVDRVMPTVMDDQSGAVFKGAGASGGRITVDGEAGTVTLLDGEDAAPLAEPEAGPRSKRGWAVATGLLMSALAVVVLRRRTRALRR